MKVGSVFNPFRVFIGAWVPNALMRYPKVSAGAKLCYARLCQYAGRNGEAYPSQTTLARELGGLSVRQVQRYINELSIEGFIKVIEPTDKERGENKTNRYVFLWHDVFEEPHDTSVRSLRQSEQEDEPHDISVVTPRHICPPPPDKNVAQRESVKIESVKESGASPNTPKEGEELPTETVGKEGTTVLEKPSKLVSKLKGQNKSPEEVIRRAQIGMMSSPEERRVVRKPVHNIGAIIAQFSADFKHCFGTTVPLETGKDRKLMKDLLDHYGYETVSSMMNWMFTYWAVFRRECRLKTDIPTLGLFYGFRDYLYGKLLEEGRVEEEGSRNEF